MTRAIAAVLVFMLFAETAALMKWPAAHLLVREAAADDGDGDGAGDDSDDGGDSDDDDNGDDSDNGGTGPGTLGGSRSGPSAGPGTGEPSLFGPLRRLFGPRPDPQPDERRTAPRQAAPPITPPAVFAEAEIIVLNINAQDLDNLIAQGFRVLQEQTLPGVPLRSHRLAVPETLTLPEARDAVRTLTSGRNADYNHFYRPGATQSQCRGELCPALELIAWPAAAQSVPGSCGIPAAIGMIDTGINGRHGVFEGADLKVIRVSSDEQPASKAIHGTAVAALFIGQPRSRVHGLLPNTRLVAVDAFHRAGRDERADAFTLVEALYRLAEERVGVINLSLAGPPNDVLEAAISVMADQRDIVLVAAAGNGGPGAAPVYPAAYPNVIAVTAVDRSKRIYRRAGRGPHIDFAAPGVDVWTAASVRGARWKTGTSFAAPFVSAAAALARSSNPGLSSPDILNLLQDGAEDLGEDGPDPIFGAGLVSAHALCR